MERAKKKNSSVLSEALKRKSNLGYCVVWVSVRFVSTAILLNLESTFLLFFFSFEFPHFYVRFRVDNKFDKTSARCVSESEKNLLSCQLSVIDSIN